MTIEDKLKFTNKSDIMCIHFCNRSLLKTEFWCPYKVKINMFKKCRLGAGSAVMRFI